MLANGQIVGDGSWNLRVLVTDLQTERPIRVKGDLHIGGVMLRLVEELGKRVIYRTPTIFFCQLIYPLYLLLRIQFFMINYRTSNVQK